MGQINLSKSTINLSKGEVINLTKEADGLSDIVIGLGWTQRGVRKQKGILQLLADAFLLDSSNEDSEIDCDAWVLASNGSNRVIGNDNDLVYYNNKVMINNNTGELVIKHHGDNLVGGNGKTDDEQISINLRAMPDKVDTVTIAVTIYRGYQRHQSFADINNIFVRIVDKRNNFEVCRFEKQDMESNAITFIAGQLYKENGCWLFRAIGASTGSASIQDEVMNSWKPYRY